MTWSTRGNGGLSAAMMVLVASLVLLVVGVLLARPAHAETFTVNSTSDREDRAVGANGCDTDVRVPGGGVGLEPECTLRAAIQEANANGQGDTIFFGSTLSGTITLTLGELPSIEDDKAETGRDLAIQGPGASTLTVSGNNGRVLEILSQANVTISGLTISDGGTAHYGGGIYNAGTLRLTNSTISGNSAYSTGGGIYSAGILTVTNSTISGNSAADYGGANSGGGIYSAGTLTVTNSTISGNSAGGSTATSVYGARGGGIYNRGGKLTVTNSTISGNSAAAGADGEAVYGGGIYSGSGTLTVTNSTISGNVASGSFGRGGGIYNGSASTATLANTIVATNRASGTFISRGYNLLGDTSHSSGWIASDLQDREDPLLGPLQANGGPTKTHALLPGSPAVDAANNTTCPA
ncbi:MAG: right-handed parallel beta-helix repeat-containing protein, partial [Actinomycetota bacterium]|nr:right-handed parallel beta-helix repeat-containing protein [Actinomycetota bacterium]